MSMYSGKLAGSKKMSKSEEVLKRVQAAEEELQLAKKALGAAPEETYSIGDRLMSNNGHKKIIVAVMVGDKRTVRAINLSDGHSGLVCATVPNNWCCIKSSNMSGFLSSHTRYWDNRKQVYTDGREQGPCRFERRQVAGGGFLGVAPIIGCHDTGIAFVVSSNMTGRDSRYATTNVAEAKEIHAVLGRILAEAK